MEMCCRIVWVQRQILTTEWWLWSWGMTTSIIIIIIITKKHQQPVSVTVCSVLPTLRTVKQSTIHTTQWPTCRHTAMTVGSWQSQRLGCVSWMLSHHHQMIDRLLSSTVTQSTYCCGNSLSSRGESHSATTWDIHAYSIHNKTYIAL